MERVPVISEIADVIDSRKGGDPKVSYVAKLFSKAPDAALKKVGEEATEVVMAAKDGDRDHLIMKLPTFGSIPWSCFLRPESVPKKCFRNSPAEREPQVWSKKRIEKNREKELITTLR